MRKRKRYCGKGRRSFEKREIACERNIVCVREGERVKKIVGENVSVRGREREKLRERLRKIDKYIYIYIAFLICPDKSLYSFEI